MKPIKLFVLADSISLHYGPYLRDFLAPVFHYDRKGGNAPAGDLNQVSVANGGNSRDCLRYLTEMLPSIAAGNDLLLFNCGLHDIKTTDAGHEVEPDEYGQNLTAVTALLQQHRLPAVWVRSTPIFDAIHNTRQPYFRRFLADVIAYNDQADRIMAAAGIPAIDLYGFTLPLGPEAYCDHAHFQDAVCRLQAAFIAGHLLSNRDRWLTPPAPAEARQQQSLQEQVK